MSTLPLISITPWLPTSSGPDNDFCRREISQALHSACVEYGFFYLDISDFVSLEETTELERLARQFFELPQVEKDKISISKQDGARGYQRLNENVTQGKPDSHEGLDFYAPVSDPDPTRPLWGVNQWPSVPGFQRQYEKWIDKMKQLGLILMEAMATGLGMTTEEWLDLRSQVDDSFWVLRVIGYPRLPDDHDGFSCGAHKDYGCLTFLYADPTPSALQVFRTTPKTDGTRKGEWINVDPTPGCVVVNIGEMWEIWSHGLYKSTLHRVIHRGENYRVSIPFFFEPNFDALVKPLPAALRMQEINARREMSASAHPQEMGQMKLYTPVTYGQFLLKKVGSNFGTGKGKYD